MVLPLVLCATLGSEAEAGAGWQHEVELRTGFVAGGAIEVTHPALHGGILQLAGSLWREWFGAAATVSFAFLGSPRIEELRGSPATSQSLDLSLIAIPLSLEWVELWTSVGTGLITTSSQVTYGPTPPQRYQASASGGPFFFDYNLHFHARAGAKLPLGDGLRFSVAGELRSCDWAFRTDAVAVCSLAGAITLGPSWRF